METKEVKRIEIVEGNVTYVKEYNSIVEYFSIQSKTEGTLYLTYKESEELLDNLQEIFNVLGAMF